MAWNAQLCLAWWRRLASSVQNEGPSGSSGGGHSVRRPGHPTERRRNRPPKVNGRGPWPPLSRVVVTPARSTRRGSSRDLGYRSPGRGDREPLWLPTMVRRESVVLARGGTARNRGRASLGSISHQVVTPACIEWRHILSLRLTAPGRGAS